MNPRDSKPAASQASSDLDQALADTFPASDTPASGQPTRAMPDHAEQAVHHAYAVLCESVSERPLEEWKTCGHGRWVSPRSRVVMLSMSPALALLDAVVKHGMREDCQWVLVRLSFPAVQMHRLDTPQEGWRERTYRNEVRRDGDRWVDEGGSALLRVPSPLCPDEYNVLVNLSHPDVGCVEVHDVQPIEVDGRLRTV